MKRIEDGLIILDFSNLAHISLNVVWSRSKKDGTKFEDIVPRIKQHILTNILNLLRKYRTYAQEVVLACDYPQSWRKHVFPEYKAHRKKTRDTSDINYPLFFDELNQFIDDLKKLFFFKTMYIGGAEGDDVIGTLVTKLHDIKTQIVIVSRDHDFCQLLRYPNVILYDPIAREERDVEDAREFLKYHIIIGDRGDGIPNIRSDNDSMTDSNKRQKPVRQTLVSKLMQPMTDEEFEDELKREGLLANWKRNKRLISLFHIPHAMQEKIINYYYTYTLPTSARDLNKYLIKHQMRNLYDRRDEFVIKPAKHSVFRDVL